MIYDSSDFTSSQSGYSTDGRLFLYEFVPTVINIAGVHLERLEKVRRSYDNVKGTVFWWSHLRTFPINNQPSIIILSDWVDSHEIISLSQIKFTTANNSYGGPCGGEGGRGHYQSQELEVVTSQEMMMMRVKIPGGLQYHDNYPVYFVCAMVEVWLIWLIQQIFV